MIHFSQIIEFLLTNLTLIRLIYTPIDSSLNVLSKVFWVQLDPKTRLAAKPEKHEAAKRWRWYQYQFSWIGDQTLHPIVLDSKEKL
jgi:hypothetical protein